MRCNEKRHNIFGLWSIDLIDQLEKDLETGSRKVENWANKIGVKTINHNGGWSLLKGSKKNIESFQKFSEDSIPINKSLNKIPENIAPIAKIINGIVMMSGDSCMLLMAILLLL